MDSNHLGNLTWRRKTKYQWVRTPPWKLTTGFEPDSWSQTSGRLPNPIYKYMKVNITSVIRIRKRIITIYTKEQSKHHKFKFRKRTETTPDWQFSYLREGALRQRIPRPRIRDSRLRWSRDVRNPLYMILLLISCRCMCMWHDLIPRYMCPAVMQCTVCLLINCGVDNLSSTTEIRYSARLFYHLILDSVRMLLVVICLIEWLSIQVLYLTC